MSHAILTRLYPHTRLRVQGELPGAWTGVRGCGCGYRRVGGGASAGAGARLSSRRFTLCSLYCDVIRGRARGHSHYLVLAGGGGAAPSHGALNSLSRSVLLRGG